MVTDSVSEIQRSRDTSQQTSLKSDSNERFEQASRTKKSNKEVEPKQYNVTDLRAVGIHVFVVVFCVVDVMLCSNIGVMFESNAIL